MLTQRGSIFGTGTSKLLCKKQICYPFPCVEGSLVSLSLALLDNIGEGDRREEGKKEGREEGRQSLINLSQACALHACL